MGKKRGKKKSIEKTKEKKGEKTKEKRKEEREKEKRTAQEREREESVRERRKREREREMPGSTFESSHAAAREDLGVDEMKVTKKPRLEGEYLEGGRVQDLMKLYYGRLFPFETMVKWLAYGNERSAKHPKADKTFFPRREFCFTLDGDIFVRYQSFKDGADLANAIRLKCPSKIDIGPVYNVDPRKRAAYTSSVSSSVDSNLRAFQATERELVFDIDMDDYNDVLNFTLDEHGWTRCWDLMAAAIRVLDRGLREDFGFEHVFFVFSGRRGIHCWVCDKRARVLTDEERGAIANYFSVYKGIEAGKAKVMLTVPKHPSVQRALEILEPVFVNQILCSQEIFETEESWERVLQYVPDVDVCEKLRDRWQSGRRSSVMPDEELNKARWLELCKEVERCVARTKDPNKRRQLVKCTDEIVLAYTYPKLDIEVSKKRNHLLKAPFCVHPKTGKVCVPIDPLKADEFDPDSVPTVAQLLNQLDASKGENWKSTKMMDAVQLFEKLFLGDLCKATQEELSEKTREHVKEARYDF